jgi:hypothetical protein
MSVKVFEVAETKEYTLKADTENPTVWTIGRIGHRLWSLLQDKHSRMEVSGIGGEAEGVVRFDVNGRNDDFVRFGVKGWTGLMDKEGKNEIPFTTVSHSTAAGNVHGISDRSLEMIRPFIAELAGEVERFNAVTGDEAKN